MKPVGIEFYDANSDRNMILVQEGSWSGWIAYKHADGQWATLRKATEEDLAKIKNRDVCSVRKKDASHYRL